MEKEEMSGIEGCYYEGDSYFEYYPGKIFSQEYGPKGARRKRHELLEREFWQEVSKVLQNHYGLAPYQARKKIYQYEERWDSTHYSTSWLYKLEPTIVAMKVM
jgi:hypothetical protein